MVAPKEVTIGKWNYFPERLVSIAMESNELLGILDSVIGRCRHEMPSAEALAELMRLRLSLSSYQHQLERCLSKHLMPADQRECEYSSVAHRKLIPSPAPKGYKPYNTKNRDISAE